MSWGLGWKRASEIFHLSLDYGDLGDPDPIPNESLANAATPPPSPAIAGDLGFRIELDWSGYDDEDQVALRLQSQLTVALPPPQDTVLIDLEEVEEERVRISTRVLKRREPLRAVRVTKAIGSSQQSDGIGVLSRLMKSNLVPADHWQSVTVLSLCGCGLTVLPAELTNLPLLERLYIDSNKLSQLPAELGGAKCLKVLNVDNNMLVSLPVELKQCVKLIELSLEHNKLVRPLLDLRSMAELRVLRLFGNPLEFLPEILTLHNLRYLSLANIRIEATENLKSVNVQIETDTSSYFIAPRHKLSPFFSLIFRFSSCHHPLLASALAKLMQDRSNHIAISKEENAVRQLISMISSGNRHVVEQACFALSSLATDVTLAMQLIKADIMQPIESVLRSVEQEELISVLQVLVTLAFTSDIVAQKLLTKDVLKSLKVLCAHKNLEVQRLALFAVGNLAFSLENRRILSQSESLRELLIRLTATSEPLVSKAAARALAILGENEILRRAIKGKPVGKQGLRILSMDGGGMKGLATVQMLKQIEQGTGRRMHELFDLICGTSTGGMLAVALTIKQMTLDQCEEIYKKLGKLVFAEPVPKDETATWREKLDQLYKSSSQSFRVVVNGSKHNADQFERLLKEMCADDDGDLLIESAVKGIPKVFVVSTLVSVLPAQPFLFRNYQYPAGTPELPSMIAESPAIGAVGTTSPNTQIGLHRGAFMGSCKHQIWQAIRASSAAPYYLDDYSHDVNRWQDGAIVANNPTVFAIREAQLLWPDTPIDCLVSVGCGSVPTKARKGGWRYLDTGQVLIESACSVERVEEVLDTLMPMLPELQYYRFNPVDEIFDMELDETDPAVWLKLEAATDEYIQKNSQSFKNVCERLLVRFQNECTTFEQKTCRSSKPTHLHSGSRLDDNSPSLGWRRMILLVESYNSPDAGKTLNHARSLETFCARNQIRLSLTNRSLGTSTLSIAFPSPFTSPLFTGSFPSSPLLYSPEKGPKRGDHIDLIPPLSLDGHQIGKPSSSPPTSPLVPRQPSVHVRSLHEKLQTLPQVGVIHLALQNDSTGSVLSWQNDVFVVAEPGELADKFLQSVKLSLSSMMRGHKMKDLSSLTKISSVSDLVAQWPKFQVGGILHRYIGRQTQVMDDNQEIGAFMFRRTVPSVHLTSEDVRWMVGAWRERIIIYTGRCGPASGLLKAFFDSGAKAVIASAAEPPDTQSLAFHGQGEYNGSDNGKFIIGDEEADDEEQEPEPDPGSPMSDWEDSDAEKASKHSMDWSDEDEDDLSRFVCLLYTMLFREGAPVGVALHHALSSHPKLRYRCHLPN